MISKLFLKVWRIEQTCIFELSWGQGQQLSAQLPVPNNLIPLYEGWQNAYLNFYQSNLRARGGISGALKKPKTDWRVKLVQAEANLLADFHRWLKGVELADIRQQIAQVAAQSDRGVATDIFLSCQDTTLARLPWESWEIGREFVATGVIRIARAPSNIRAETVQQRRKGRMRILAILGDNTGLDLQQDQTAVRSLGKLLDLQFVGWKPGKNPLTVKEEIQQAIADPQGWDLLFFAGHSNETNLTGGELSIAPDTSIVLNEIAPQLEVAKQQGLKFALFNSCKGLSLAETLINLGLSQVAVMREPIHNAVAQEFLTAFLKALAQYEDVHTAMESANQFLKTELNMTYPSASLVPSLFRHPNSVPLKLEPFGWKNRLRQLAPTKVETVWVGGLMALSLLQPVQFSLLGGRMLAQSIYRDWTNQLAVATSPLEQSIDLPKLAEPPVALIQIDDETIREEGITSIKPISRTYLSQLIDQLNDLSADTIGVDYLLDRESPLGQADDQQLRLAIEKTIAQGSKLIFAVSLNNQGGWLEPLDQFSLAGSDSYGDVDLLGQPTYLAQTAFPDQEQPTFSYQLVKSKINDNDLYNQLSVRVQPEHWLTNFSYKLAQAWFHPVIDYSIPTHLIYEPISAFQLSKQSSDFLNKSHLSQKIILIAPGGYSEAGLTDGGDLFPVPHAARYWWNHQHLQDWDWTQREEMTGGEIHAYQAFHLLHQGFIIPIPDLWLLGVHIILAKISQILFFSGKSFRFWMGSLTVFSVFYCILSLQAYILLKVLIPIAFPFILLLGYVGIQYWENRSA